jgi:trimethylamine:corrinoid methyltransferase-like protein
MMRTIGIAAKTTSPDALAYAKQVGGELRERGLSVIFDEEMAREVGITTDPASRRRSSAATPTC